MKIAEHQQTEHQQTEHQQTEHQQTEHQQTEHQQTEHQQTEDEQDKDKHKETARFNFNESPHNFSEAEEEAIKNFPKILDKKFRDIMDTGTFTPKEMFNLLYPFIGAPNIVSKICAVAGEDNRHVNLKLMVAMRRVFGMSIDELLDECFQSLPDREPPKK